MPRQLQNSKKTQQRPSTDQGTFGAADASRISVGKLKTKSGYEIENASLMTNHATLGLIAALTLAGVVAIASLLVVREIVHAIPHDRGTGAEQGMTSPEKH